MGDQHRRIRLCILFHARRTDPVLCRLAGGRAHRLAAALRPELWLAPGMAAKAGGAFRACPKECAAGGRGCDRMGLRSEEHTSELQSLMRISYAVFCLKKKKKKHNKQRSTKTTTLTTTHR